MTASTAEKDFNEFIRSADFPCVGAKSALARDALTLFSAGAMDRPTHDVELYQALGAFGETLDTESPIVRSFVAIFDGPDFETEEDFETALWDRLQCLHNLDAVSKTDWTDDADPDPSSPHFSLSVAGNAYFVIGLHPAASRPARRFGRPALVFNSHAQFDKLRADGKYDRMKAVIRERDALLAGSINPMLDDFGRSSEARQYSGREVGPDWKCPLHVNEVS